MTEQHTRIRPPKTASKEQLKKLEDGALARKKSLEKDAKSGNASRSTNNPDVGRPSQLKESTQQKGAAKDVS